MLIFLQSLESDSAKAQMEQIYENYIALINKKISQAIPANDVNDCVQDCLVRLVRNMHQLQKLKPPQITRYVLRVIRSVILDYKKKKKLLTQIIEMDAIPEFDSGISSPVEKVLEDKEMRERLVKGFNRLSEIDQIILRSLYQEQLSRDELAKRLGIKPASVRTYITRAKKRTLQLMKGDEYER